MNSTRVIIVTDDVNYKIHLKRLFMNSGHSVIGEADHQSAALRLVKSRLPDLIIVDGDCMNVNITNLIEIIEQDPCSALIVLTQQLQKQLVEKAKELWFYFYMLKQLPDTMLVSNVEVAHAMFKRTKKMEQEIDKLKKTLETRKVVEKAKGLLMKELDMTEDEAFRHVQKISMDKCLPMKEVANAIIITYS
ncbi:ANTAR domain-containing response regulator [Desulfuribacillus alkaliarsenatis]|uniref:Stage 0 sporulation protein A homolog n=1 Tax=Desulfuribacillus alkaliarsenatis TaxID=766136 RepID=A0A1E5G0D1_9FIRM|nr:ANTAR domain-containing protein [Desulfuribacillus alkaliarsenatis]OEF96274.1 hypothetical protein BHF68_08925 [Desulfuribacillus alkaliarsenatis]